MSVRGYTLLEMIIVLAIIALLAALSTPAVRSSLRSGEFRNAAKQVRAGLANARLRAIESGTAQQLRFQPGERLFEVRPQPMLGVGEGLAFVSSQTLAAGVSPGGISAGQRTAEDEPTRYELPEGVRFGSQQLSDRNVPDQPSFDSGSTARLDAHRWSAPIVFYPNGRTRNARIRLIGGREWYVDVTLRGVTGTARIGALVRREQTP